MTTTTLSFRHGNVGAGFIEEVVFPNGKVLRIPAITKSIRGGWYYHPIFKQRNGKPQVLGRANEGRTKSIEAMEELLTVAYVTGDWEVPIVFSPKITASDLHSVSPSRDNRNHALVRLPTDFGYIQFSIGPLSRFQTDGEWNVEVVAPSAVVASWIKQVPSLNHPCISLSFKTTHDKAEIYVDKMLSSPVDAFAEFFKGREIDISTVAGEFVIKGELISDWLKTIKFYMDYDRDHFTAAKDSYGGKVIESDAVDSVTGRAEYESEYLISDSVLSLSKSWRQAFIENEAITAFRQLSTIFQASGVTFDLDTLRKYDATTKASKDFVKSLSITIPEGGKHNRGGHTIVITPDDFQVVQCGYVTDEESYIDDAKRQALSEIQEAIVD